MKIISVIIKIRIDILDKVCGDNVNEVYSEKDDVYKNNSINRFIKILNNNKRGIQSSKKLLWKKVSKNLCVRFKFL